MKILQNTKQSTKANTTISAHQDVKNPSRQTPKNTLVVTRQLKVAIAVTTNAKPLEVSLYRSFFVSWHFFAQLNYGILVFRNEKNNCKRTLGAKLGFSRVIVFLQLHLMVEPALPQLPSDRKILKLPSGCPLLL